MRRWISVALMTSVVLAMSFAPLQARRSGSILFGSSSCEERARDGSCLSDGNSTGSLIYWVVLGTLALGGGAFRLLRSSASLVARGASAVTRRTTRQGGHSDWADKVAARFGPVQDEAAMPAEKLPSATTDAPRRGTTVVVSGPKRSSGFGGGRPAGPTDTPVVAAAPPPAGEPLRPAAGPASRSAATLAPRTLRQPRLGGAEHRAQFGMRRA